MKQCKYCMQEIDQKATVCPFCRRRQIDKRKTKLIIKIIICTIVLLLLLSSIYCDYEEKDLRISGLKSYNMIGYIEYNGTIKNFANYRKRNITIDIRCTDYNNVVVMEETKTIKYIEPGESVSISASGFSNTASKVRCNAEVRNNIFRLFHQLFV